MANLNAVISKEMNNWIENKIRKGNYKSKSDLVRTLIKRTIEFEKYPEAMASRKVLNEIWKQEKDAVWEIYL